MGYRVDFEKMKIVATGGIYVRTFPAADQITIDSKINKTPGLFANSIFTQSLLPKNHTVSIKKDGYYDYNKTLPVQEKEVTKLENVLLFKKNILFEAVIDETQSPFNQQDKFFIKNNSLYYSNISANIGITTIQKSTPVLKNLIAFTISNNNIIWLGTDGLLYKSELASLSVNPVKLTLTPLEIDKKGFYKISPDGKNIVYFTNQEIYIFLLSDPITLQQNSGQDKRVLLYKSKENITDCLWLNNDYVIFNTGDKIIISEIDYRGNINTVTLPQTADKIFFNRQDNKLYILTENTLLSSEKLTP